MIKADENLMKKVCEFTVKELRSDILRIRSMSCQVLVEFATHLEPEVLAYSKPILEGLVGVLKGNFATPNNPKIIRCVWDAINTWVSEMKDGAKGVLSGLMSVLNASLKDENSDDIKTSVVQVLGSLAGAVGKEFVQYYEPCMKALSFYVTPTVLDNRKEDEDYVDLVGAAWVTIGQIVLAVGSDSIQNINDIIAITNNLIKLMQLENAPASSGYTYIACLAMLLKQNLINQPFCPALLELLYNNLEGDDGFEIVEDKELGPSAEQFGFEVENKEELFFTDVNPTCKMQIKSVIIQERCQAINLAKVLCEHVPFPMDTLREIYGRVVLSFAYPHPTLRIGVTEALNEFIKAVIRRHPIQPWKPGVQNNIPEEVNRYLSEIVLFWMSTIEEDDDADNVTLVLEHLAELIEMIGPVFFVT